MAWGFVTKYISKMKMELNMKKKQLNIKLIISFTFLYIAYNSNVISAVTERKVISHVFLLIGLTMYLICLILFKQLEINKKDLLKFIYVIGIFIVYLLINLFLKSFSNYEGWIKSIEFILVCITILLILMSNLNSKNIIIFARVFLTLNIIMFTILIIRYYDEWIYRMLVGWRISTKSITSIWLGRFFAEIAVLSLMCFNNKIVKTIVNIIMFLLIIGTGSKGVIIGLIIVYLILMVKKIKSLLKNKNSIEIKSIIKNSIILTLIILSVTIFILIKYVPVEFIKERLLSESSYGGAGRVSLYSKAIELFMQNVFLGCGIGNYFYQYAEFTFTYPHNIILEFMCELGIIGFMFFALFIYYVIKNILEKYKNSNISILIMLFIMYLLNAMLSGNNVLDNFQFYILGTMIIKYSAIGCEQEHM